MIPFVMIIAFIFLFFRAHVTETVLSVTSKSKFIRIAKDMEWGKIRDTHDSQIISARCPMRTKPLAIVDGTFKGKHIYVLIDVLEGTHHTTTIFIEHDANVKGPVGITRRAWSDLQQSKIKMGNPVFDRGYEISCSHPEDEKLIKKSLDEGIQEELIKQYLYLTINPKGVFTKKQSFSKSEVRPMIEVIARIVDSLNSNTPVY